jgi:hypothetical protein
MATYTSSQSGNFSSSATWGGAGVPGNGDRFDVSSGHTVTIDTGISVPSTGYADSYVYGILQSQASQNTTLRMNGRLYIKGGGTLHLRAGATIQINGSSAEQHGIWIENEDGASCIMEGSDGMPTTTLSANVTEGSIVLPFTSATNFTTGEWIAVYNNHTTVGATNSHEYQHTDEGFWVHDKDSNNVYFRLFGGPDDVTISNVSGNAITVTNAKVFRKGQQIIFGFGANRNIKVIEDINYATNEITCGDYFNIVQDNNYDSGTWSAIFGGSFTTGQEDYKGGYNAVRYQGAPGTSVLLRVAHDSFTPTAGVEYTVSFWVKKISGDTGGLSLDWHDNNPNGSWQNELVTGKWVKIERTGTPSISAKTFVDIIGNTDHNYVLDIADLRAEAKNITGSVVGSTVYLTGTEKGHLSSDKVRKMAAITTAAASSGATAIVLSNSNMFATNDDIWIEWKSEASSSTDYVGSYDVSTDGTSNAGKTKYTVTSVVENTVNITPALKYNVAAGSLVHRLTRDVVCETVATDGSDYAFFYSEYVSSNYNKKIILKDVYFNNWGNDDANYMTGVTIRGYNSTDSLPVTLTETVPARGREPWIEGVALYAYPDNTHRNDWGGLWLYDTRYAKARCCITVNSDEGFGIYYEPGVSIANCIASQCREWGFRLEGQNEWYENAYLYANRCRYGFRIINPYEYGLGTHDIISEAHTYDIYVYHGNSAIYRSRFKGSRYGFVHENASLQLVYCQVTPLSGLVSVDADTGTTQAGAYYNSRAFRTNAQKPLKSVEHNYEYDAMRLYMYNGEAKWDRNENAWKAYHRYDNDHQPALGEMVYIPANTIVRVEAKVKLSPGFSGTYPVLFAHDLISATGENYVGVTAADASIWAGKRYLDDYTAAAATAYETKQIVIEAKPYSRYFYIGTYTNNRNATEGYWAKDHRIFFDSPYAIPAFNNANDSGVLFGRSIVGIRDSFTQTKKRFGG